MGAWGHEIFDNDAACDWLDRLLVRDDLVWIETTLDQVNQADDTIDIEQASAALAACETLAFLRGRPGLHEAPLDSLKQWADAHQHLGTDHLVAPAAAALGRINSDQCQLKQSWQEANQYDPWAATVDDVARRIA